MKSRAFLGALICASGCAYTATAVAADPLGFYIGGSAGRSNVRTSIATPPPYSFSESDTAWKAVVGLRPIPLVAAEFSYIDLGHPDSSYNFNGGTLHANVRQRGTTLSALLFAPIPLPLLDLYARAGVARLESSGNGTLTCTGIYCAAIVPPNLGFDHTNTDFLYGAGVQLKFSALAVRIEYERINDSPSNPDLVSAGVLLRF